MNTMIRTSIGNGIMRGVCNALLAGLKGHVPVSVLPHWEYAKDWDSLLDSAEAFQDYCDSYGWEICEYNIRDWLTDNTYDGTNW